MGSFATRMIDERLALIIKINKLENFTKSESYFLLSKDEKELLKSQLIVMKQYVDILDQRILIAEQNVKNEPSLGEMRVQRNFNPTANVQVEHIKSKFAEIIDEIELFRNERNGRECSLAQTESETACMYAVKSLFV